MEGAEKQDATKRNEAKWKMKRTDGETRASESLSGRVAEMQDQKSNLI